MFFVEGCRIVTATAKILVFYELEKVRAAALAARMRRPECSMTVPGSTPRGPRMRRRLPKGIGKIIALRDLRLRNGGAIGACNTAIDEYQEMPALKMSAARILAGLAASALFVPAICAAARVQVNDEAPLDLQSPPGFTYTTGGANATLSVATTGYMACANITNDVGSMLTNISMVPQHGQWRFPGAVDLRGVGYGTGTLAIGRNSAGTINSSLTCHTAGAEGEILQPLSDGILSTGFDSKMVEQFSNLVNWVPGQGFSWSNPDWTLVPTDPCTPSVDQPARADETVSCGAVSGAKPGVSTGTVRSPTLWTESDLVNFYYVVRIDARWGEPTGGLQDSGSVLPSTNLPQTNYGTVYKIVEAYSRGVTGVGGGFLGDTGQWCLLESLPSALDSNVCNGSPVTGTMNGPFVSAETPTDNNIVVSVGAAPFATPRVSFYMAFIRPVVGAPPRPRRPPVVSYTSLVLDGASRAVG